MGFWRKLPWGTSKSRGLSFMFMINFPSSFWEFLGSISGQSHRYTRWLCTKCTSGDLGCRWVVQVASQKIEIEVVKQDMWILLAKTRRISHNWSTVRLLWTAHWQIGGQRQRNSCPEGFLEAGAVTISLWGGCRGCRWSCSVWGFHVELHLVGVFKCLMIFNRIWDKDPGWLSYFSGGWLHHQPLHATFSMLQSRFLVDSCWMKS